MEGPALLNNRNRHRSGGSPLYTQDPARDVGGIHIYFFFLVVFLKRSVCFVTPLVVSADTCKSFEDFSSPQCSESLKLGALES